MKTIKIIFIAAFAVCMSVNTHAQTQDHSNTTSTPVTSKTETFKVSGNCDMCKATIEKAAKVEGVTKASWDKKTKLVTLTYDPSKVKTDDVLKKIATSGYDNEKFKADDKAYKALPGCCKYSRAN